MNGNYSTSDLENYDKRLKPILNLWKKLTLGSSVLQSYKTIPNEAPRTAWTSFILSEIRLAGRLFETIHSTLVHLHSLTKDNSSLQQEDIQLMANVSENLVPMKWRQIWNGSRTLTEYVKGVVSRSIEAERRFKTMMHLDFGEEIDFVSVFNIESYLAALKLTNAKEIGQSTCDIDLKSTLLSRIEKSNLTCPKVGSIMIDGAVFRNGKVVMFDRTTSSQSNTIPDFQINFNVDNEVLEND
ncbi:Cytoplasmic dynein 2 heavy chain 1, partial [Pseudolycoriella hygida]